MHGNPSTLRMTGSNTFDKFVDVRERGRMQMNFGFTDL
jgi:hypothetical protein